MNKRYLHAGFICTGFAFIILLILLTGCGAGYELTQGTIVLYEGIPYGDLSGINTQVAICMGAIPSNPIIIIVDHEFICKTDEGKVWSNGCYVEGKIIMYDKSLIGSKGSLFSHELTHYYGDDGQINECGKIKKEGFRL